MRKIKLNNSFSDHVYLVTGASEARFKAYIKSNYPDYKGWQEGEAGGRMEDPEGNGMKIIYVWIGKHESLPDRRLTVIHEAIHVVMSLFTECGVPLTAENDEAFAYVHGDLCRQMFRRLKL